MKPFSSIRFAVATIVSCVAASGLLAQSAPLSAQQGQTAPKAARSDQQKANPDALTLVDFKERIEKYVELRKQAEKSVPPLKETNDPAKIQEAQNGLAASIRVLRAGAKAGDLFTPPIRDKFRRLLYPPTNDEEGREAKKILKDDAPPASAVPLEVNAKYPETAPLPTVPVNLLLSLPTLPDELEYRILGKHLILRDVKANIIVDYIPNVIR